MLDSTADFPDAQIRFPNMRVVPLYVRFGEESFRDYVELDPHGFYERLRTARRAADDLAADAAGLRLDLPRARRLRAHLLAAHLVEALGHVPERVAGRGRRAATASAWSTRSRPRSGSACSRSRSRSCSSAGRPTRRSRRSSGRYRERARASSSRSTRSSSSPRAAASAAARRSPGSLLNVKPILTIEDGEVVPLTRVRGRQKALEEFRKRFEEATTDGPGLGVGIAHAEAEDDGRAAAGDRPRGAAAGARSSSSRASAPSSARTPARARSASSGSRSASRTCCDTRRMSRPQPGFAAVDPPAAGGRRPAAASARSASTRRSTRSPASARR